MQVVIPSKAVHDQFFTVLHFCSLPCLHYRFSPPLESLTDPLQIIERLRKEPELGFLYLTPRYDCRSSRYNPYNLRYRTYMYMYNVHTCICICIHMNCASVIASTLHVHTRHCLLHRFFQSIELDHLTCMSACVYRKSRRPINMLLDYICAEERIYM